MSCTIKMCMDKDNVERRNSPHITSLSTSMLTSEWDCCPRRAIIYRARTEALSFGEGVVKGDELIRDENEIKPVTLPEP